MLEKWKITINQKGSTGPLLTDLRKAFHCELIANLEAYGFDYNSLQITCIYHSSSWYGAPCDVPQGSTLRPLLFNIYLYDLFKYCKLYSRQNPLCHGRKYCIGCHRPRIGIQNLISMSSSLKTNRDKSYLLLLLLLLLQELQLLCFDWQS